MLHQDVLMADIDVDQWRNAQALLLSSAKAARRIVVIHERGEVVKLRHTEGAEVRGPVRRVEDPRETARALYEANREAVDVVVVMERNAVDAYFARVQDSWDIEEDLDVFVQRTYATLDDFAEGIVTHPGPARERLGLQWRLGASHAEIRQLLEAVVAPVTTVILGVHDGGALWASLVLDVDEGHKISSITTADPARVDLAGTRDEVLDRLVEWQEAAGRTVSVGIGLDRGAAEELLAAPASEKPAVLQRLVAGGRASVRG